MNLQSTGMSFFKECIKQVLGLESSLDILSATKSLANTGLEAFTSEKCHFDESCIGEVYTSGNRSNMHLGQIFVLGGYRQDDLYSGKMTDVNGKLELNFDLSPLMYTLPIQLSSVSMLYIVSTPARSSEPFLDA
jgi:hypothetical protein